MKKTVLIIIAMVFGFTLFTSVASAQDSFFQKWGISYVINEDMDIDNEDLKAMGMMLQLSRDWINWENSSLVFKIEAISQGFWNYGTGMEISLVPALRLMYQGFKSCKPYLEGGIGPSYTTLCIYELGTRFNFHSFAGVGLSFSLGKDTDLEIGLRLRHISNAGLDERNHGVTSSQFQIGLAYNF